MPPGGGEGRSVAVDDSSESAVLEEERRARGLEADRAHAVGRKGAFALALEIEIPLALPGADDGIGAVRLVDDVERHARGAIQTDGDAGGVDPLRILRDGRRTLLDEQREIRTAVGVEVAARADRIEALALRPRRDVRRDGRDRPRPESRRDPCGARVIE